MQNPQIEEDGQSGSLRNCSHFHVKCLFELTMPEFVYVASNQRFLDQIEYFLKVFQNFMRCPREHLNQQPPSPTNEIFMRSSSS